MASNYLEQVLIEWYEYKGYFVKNNILVGRRNNGGYDAELDIVAFNPVDNHLVHLEPSMDADSWEKREKRYKLKFDAGRKHIPGLFNGLVIPEKIDQLAVFVFGSNKNHKEIGGGQVIPFSEIVEQIFIEFKNRKRIHFKIVV